MTNGKTGLLDRLVLNTVQREAVIHNGGPQLVFAGAGTGKTRVLTAKIAWLIDRGMHSSRIFAATFTNKAAKEMRERVECFTGQPVTSLWIGTFHSLCVRILRQECTAIGYERGFSIFDTADQTALLRKVLKRLEIDEHSATPRQVLSMISRFKGRCLHPDDVRLSASGFYEQENARIYLAYQQMLREQQAMDFDDLLMHTVCLLRDTSSILEKYQNRFDYVLVDEYQDTNETQVQLVKLLAGKHNRIFAVGDDDQSIYGWRGAQVENILQFERHFTGTAVFKLEQNYRSTAAILDFANSAISGNINRAAKRLWTDSGRGESVIVNRYRDDRQEADDAVAMIAGLCKEKTNGGNIAVLFRTNAQSRVFEESLRKRQIMYVLVGGTGFYERAEIKDCLAYLRLLVNPSDNVAFERIYNTPGRGLGEKALEALAQQASEKKCSLLTALLTSDSEAFGSRFKKGFSDLREIFQLLTDSALQGEAPHKLLREVMQLSGYMDMLSEQQNEEASGRIENINELLNALTVWSGENPEKGLASFLEEVSLVSDIDGWNNRENAVNLMTMHCAKGLEFEFVFLVGIEEGLLPSRQNQDDESKVEEERRLLYVGATRAMQSLVCSFVDRRYRFGEVTPQSPSRFLLAIDKTKYTLVDKTTDFGSLPTQQTSVKHVRTPQQRFERERISDVQPGAPKHRVDDNDNDFSQDIVQYRMGQHVRHSKYGRGKIVSISGFGADMKVMVLFNDGSRKSLMARFAKFEHD
jgi:DNA helicase-2/ATP-dependent DNA helicase PcrA